MKIRQAIKIYKTERSHRIKTIYKAKRVFTINDYFKDLGFKVKLVIYLNISVHSNKAKLGFFAGGL